MILNIKNLHKLAKMNDMKKVQIRLEQRGKQDNMFGIQMFKCLILMK